MFIPCGGKKMLQTWTPRQVASQLLSSLIGTYPFKSQMRAVERMNSDQPSFGSSSTSILLLARRPAKRKKSVVLTSPDLCHVKHA